ncbi:hypothetical protein J4421_04120 [Candidatus Woesearchaeota archaeon]|nr:hypothetical protein [Candidatus Woesearchaeota archaeon]
MTSLCGIVFPGGALIYSDLQATSERSRRSSASETKIYQVGDERVLLAGTGSIEGIIIGKERAGEEIRKWKSLHGLRPIPPSEVGEILRQVMTPEDEAYFVLAAYDPETDQAEIAEVGDSGVAWPHGLVQVLGSGKVYMHSPALKLEEQILARMKSHIVSTAQKYDALPKLKFPKEVAMIAGLEIINCGPASDVFSGGLGYQLMTLTKEGVQQYLIPRDEAQKLLAGKWEAEFAAINPQLQHRRFKEHLEKFEPWRVK